MSMQLFILILNTGASLQIDESSKGVNLNLHCQSKEERLSMQNMCRSLY